MTSDQPAHGAWRGLARAWETRLAARRRPHETLVLPIAGGAGSLLQRRDARRLVTTIASAEPPASSPLLTRWLERRQARRSAILIVPDRATGIAMAVRWGLDPQRFRLGGATAPLSARVAEQARHAVPWHDKGESETRA